MSDRIKIILADDHQLLTNGLKMTIDEWDEFEVVAIASNGKEAVKKADLYNPDIMLMDMQMPEMSGDVAAKTIKSKHPEIKMVALTTFDDTETVMSVLNAGFDGFLLKVIDSAQLRSSLHSIMNGINVFDESAMRQIRTRMETHSDCSFSDRELEILRYICQGLTNIEIAQKLSLRPGTVKNIVSLLLSKTYCVSRAHLTRYAIENHLVDIQE